MAVLSRRVRPQDWRPVGVDELEDNALAVVRSAEHRSVIAGPGAGKTELLAQRSAYLLQTGLAAAPQRILAISFKRDAATNLAARVRERCHRDHSSRLDSMTFDAFGKSLLDRFGQTLPEQWRPSRDYQVVFPTDRDYDYFLNREVGRPPADVGTVADLREISSRSFQRRYLFRSPLPAEGIVPTSVGKWAARAYWQRMLKTDARSMLSFPMIGRLAELMLRLNPMALEALRLTYSHLFMDEFQDTTRTQYDLVRTMFGGSNTVITAVGDNKQQIMRWAMAMDDPFSTFDADYGATRTPLFNNYRSSPTLVAVQHVLAKALDDQAVAPVSKAISRIDDESCAIWDFSSPDAEANTLAAFVSSQMKSRGLAPRDFVLLVRQKPHEYAHQLVPAFAHNGLLLRNEAAMIGEVALQELLAEEASELLLAMLRLATTHRAGRYWSECQESIAAIRNIGPDQERERALLSKEIDTFVLTLAADSPAPPSSRREAGRMVDNIVDFIGRRQLMAFHPAYGQGGWLDKVLHAAAQHLATSAQDAADWTEALDAYEGVGAVPLMTIHKSKGLEYDTVVFVGLDDGAWWSFANDEVEATAGFFVAFTRAKQRVVFTYCPARGARSTIATLYDLLAAAGVQSQQIA